MIHFHAKPTALRTGNGVFTPAAILIECGPVATPLDGAHFCGFAGAGRPPKHGVQPGINAIAFCLLDGINLLDPIRAANLALQGRVRRAFPMSW